MSNATQELVNEEIASKQPPGNNADALIEQAQAEIGGGGGGGEAGQMNLPGVPSPPPFSAGGSVAVPSGFDPTVHESDAAGKPVLNTDGTLRRIRGRKPGVPQRGAGGKFSKGVKVESTPSDASTVPGGASLTGIAPENVPVPPPAPELTREAARLAASMYVQMGLALGQGVFGDEWKPDEPAEENRLVDVTAEYLYATQSPSLSPGIVLAMACGQYSFKRVQRPKTLEKLKHYFLAIRKWIIGR